jgi:hypothetical protein
MTKEDLAKMLIKPLTQAIKYLDASPIKTAAILGYMLKFLETMNESDEVKSKGIINDI